VQLSFQNPLIYWRGPSPFHFIQVPEAQSKKIKTIAAQISYGWGVLPVMVKINKLEFSTALFPKDGVYLVPIKNEVRFKLALELDQEVKVTLRLGE
jgi:hypothetical protein